MAMSVGSGGDAPMCEMNTTPLIDVMLVLLVTLIVTLPVLLHDVKLDMPPPTNQPPPPVQPQVIDLDIFYNGSIAWNGTPVNSLKQLNSQFAQASLENPQPEVHLSPDGHVKYNIVAEVLAAAQRNHMAKIGFVNTSQFVQF